MSPKTKYFYRIIANGSGGAKATSSDFYGVTKVTNGSESKPTTPTTIKK